MTPDDPVVTPIIAIASLAGAGSAIHSSRQSAKQARKQEDDAERLEAEARERSEQSKATDAVRRARERQRALAGQYSARRSDVKTTPLGLTGQGQTQLGAA